MNKDKQIEIFYNSYLKLQEIKRTGWVLRNIPDDKIETVADHTLQITLLAMLFCNEFKLDFDLSKVLPMCLIHDIGEIIIGDVALVDESYDEKKKHERQAVIEMLEPLSSNSKEYYLSLWDELNERSTPLAQFVYQVDKIDAIMRAKKYSIDYNRPELFEEFYNQQKDNKTFFNSSLKDFFDNLIDN